jgi:RNA polymerase sigma-70 factor (ECF subfamily)
MADHPFAAELLARMPAPDRMAGVAAADIEARLVELGAAGRAAWPGVALAELDFVRHLAERLDGEGAGLALLAPIRGDELFLACACVRGLPRALDAFERRYLQPARAYLARFATGAALDDLLQDVRAKLFVATSSRPARIAEYAGRGSLEGWLRVVAVRVAVDSAEKGKRLRNLTDDEQAADLTVLGAADPELSYIRSQHKADFAAAFREAMATLTGEERTLLRLYLVDKLNIAEIGTLTHIHRATVARHIARCRERVLEETRTRLRARLGCTDSEVESMIGLLNSQLDVSLHAYLRTPV